MANGDVTHVKELGRVTLGGGMGGNTLTGVAKNEKVLVWGEISATWADTTGIKLTDSGGPRALGLATMDYVQFDVKKVDTTFNIDEGIWTAAYNTSTENIMVVIDGLTNPTAGNVCLINYFAVGDNAAVSELL